MTHRTDTILYRLVHFIPYYIDIEGGGDKCKSKSENKYFYLDVLEMDHK